MDQGGRQSGPVGDTGKENLCGLVQLFIVTFLTNIKDLLLVISVEEIHQQHSRRKGSPRDHEGDQSSRKQVTNIRPLEVHAQFSSPFASIE
jgi:hypothetical protein